MLSLEIAKAQRCKNAFSFSRHSGAFALCVEFLVLSESGAEATAIQNSSRSRKRLALATASGLRRVRGRFLQVSRRRDSNYSALNLSLLTSAPAIFFVGIQTAIR
jgi:hypothetical protein